MSRSRALKQNWLLASLSFYWENLELWPLFPPLLGPNLLLRELEIVPCSQAGAPWGCHTSKSVHIASQEASLHANRMHWPWLMACRRGLGHRLQLLLGLPYMMELLELFHHAVFEVWV